MTADGISSSWCVWPGCQEKRWQDLAICRVHTELSAKRAREQPPTPEEIEAAVQSWRNWKPRPDLPSVVYYLLVKPGVVKIGYSGNFYSRLKGLRGELSEVLALELGGRELERSRHKQFEIDRIIRGREDFVLSELLDQHIKTLTPQREALLKAVMPQWFSSSSQP